MPAFPAIDDAAAYIDARRALHWAAQPLVALADAALPHAPDDRHANLGVDPAWTGWTGRPLPDGRRAALRLETPALVLGQDAEHPEHARTLEGVTLHQAVEWIRAHAPGASQARLREYDMPDHPVAGGQPFHFASLAALRAVTDWSVAGQLALARATRSRPTPAPPRLWPHHLDFGAIVLRRPEDDPETDPAIGLGLSLGDSQHELPYFYVSGYHLTGGADPLPTLPAAALWNDTRTGATLPAAPGVGFTETQVIAFLSDTIEALAARFPAP